MQRNSSCPKEDKVEEEWERKQSSKNKAAWLQSPSLWSRAQLFWVLASAPFCSALYPPGASRPVFCILNYNNSFITPQNTNEVKQK